MAQAKVLIVEDEEFLRDVYVDTLSPQGYSIEVAKDGEEALQKIKAGDWDLILLDILLPKLTAFDILEKLNNDPTYNKAKNKNILFLTNLDSEADMHRALALGGHGYLIKSNITPGELVQNIKSFLEKSASEKTSILAN